MSLDFVRGKSVAKNLFQPLGLHRKRKGRMERFEPCLAGLDCRSFYTEARISNVNEKVGGGTGVGK